MRKRGTSTEGIGVPFVWIRRVLAQRLGVAPLEIDCWPASEVELELKLMAIEAEEG